LHTSSRIGIRGDLLSSSPSHRSVCSFEAVSRCVAANAREQKAVQPLSRAIYFKCLPPAGLPRDRTVFTNSQEVVLTGPRDAVLNVEEDHVFRG